MKHRIMRYGLLLSILITILATSGVAQDSSAGNSDVSEVLGKLGFRPPPKAHGDAEVREQRELREAMDEDRRRILMPGAEISQEEIEALAEKFAPKIRRLEELRVQRLQWEAYQKDPESEWWSAAEPDVPTIGPATVDTSASLDLLEFYWLLKRFQSLRYRSLQDVTNSSGKGLPDPSAMEAISLARRFEACAQGRIELGGGSSKGCYRLRAASLQGWCWLLAAWHYDREANDAEAYRCWERGIDALHRVDVVFKTAERTGVDIAPLDRLPPIKSEHLNSLIEKHPVTLLNYEWNENTHLIGFDGSALSEQSTVKVVRSLLADNCPWGVPIFHFLKDQGLTEGIDRTILRGQAFGPGEKIWVRNVGPASIPPSVREEIDEIRKGNFTVGGKPLHIEWEAVQGANDLSVWFVSPTVTDMSAGAFLGVVSKSATIASCGLIGIAADLAGDLVGMAADWMWPDNAPLQIGIGTLAEANKWEFDEAYSIKTEDISGVSLLKGGLLKVLDAVEKAEMEELFDGLDPDQGLITDSLGGQTTYDGSWMPPVILRAVIKGHEKVAGNEYKRLWVVTKYWTLDPRGLAGAPRPGDLSLHDSTGPWDLSKQLVSELPGAAAYRAGQVETSRRTWWALPDVHEVGWGSRVHMIGLGPEYQWMDLVVEPELEKEWRAACAEDETIGYVLRYPPPEEGRVDSVPLGTPLGFHNIDFKPGNLSHGGFFRQKIYCEYDLRIVRAPLDRDGISIQPDSPRVVELARMPVRFVNRGGKPPTGELTFYDNYLRVDQIVRYEGRPDRMYDLNPSTEGMDPIPPAIAMHSAPIRDENVYGSLFSDDHYSLECAYGPAEKDRWYKLVVTVEHPQLPMAQQFVLYDKCMALSGCVYFQGKIPVRPGLSKIKLEIPGLSSKQILVERKPPRARDPIDMAREEKHLREKLEERARARNQYQQLSAHAGIIGSKIGLANQLADRERYGSARDVLHEVPQFWPDLRQIQDDRQRDRYYDMQERYLEILVRVVYHQGDAETLGRELPNWLHRKRAEADRRASKNVGMAADYYMYVAKDYDKWIDRLLVIGGSPEVAAPLIAEWNELRRLCGKARPGFDSRRFRHPKLAQ